MRVIIQPEISIELPEVKLLAVRDIIAERRIIARIDGIPKGVILWDKAEYDGADAQTWTNESALQRAILKLSQTYVPFDS
jgi:hypothetical protein